MASPHVFVALSSHGLGHLAQVAPVLNELRRRLPGLRLTIQSTLAEATLRNRISGHFTYIPEATDVGMIMANAVKIRLDESATAYEAFHNRWDLRLHREMNLLERVAPDLLLANIPYLPLAAACRLGLPAIALCSLNWFDISQGCGLQHPALGVWRQTMLAAYQSAATFLKPVPFMPMPDLTNSCAIGPIAVLGQNRRREINARLGLSEQQALILIALGGIHMPLPIADWPCYSDLCWIIPKGWGIQRTDIRHREQLGNMTFPDLLCSCDAILGKPGYGTFTEAVCNGKPVLYLERDNWPEAIWLVDWLLDHGNGLKITRQDIETGALRPALQSLTIQPRKPALYPTGIAAATECLAHHLEP